MIGGAAGLGQVALTLDPWVKRERGRGVGAEVRVEMLGTEETSVEIVIRIDQGQGQGQERGGEDHIQARDLDHQEDRGQGLRLIDQEGGVIRHTVKGTRGEGSKHK